MSATNSPTNESISAESSSPSKRRRNTVISEHVKKLIIEKHFDEDLSVTKIARFFNLSWSTVNHIIERYMERGTVESMPRGGRAKTLVMLTVEHTEFIINLLDNDCQLTMGLIRDELFKRFPALADKGVSPQQIHKHIMQKIGFTIKRTKPVEKKRNSLDIIENRKKFARTGNLV